MRAEVICLAVLASQYISMTSTDAAATEYRIGTWYPTTKDATVSMFKPVFQDYLNRVVGQSLNVRFTVVPVDFEPESVAENLIVDKQIDFLYSMAGRMACVEVEFDWIVIATARVNLLGKETGAQGTIIYSLQSNSAIQGISDFKGKRIGLAHILSSSFYLSETVVFYGNDYAAQVHDVLNGKVDVGFTASTVLYQKFADAIPQLRFHALLPNASFEGEVYPLPTSTPLTPQFSVAASPDVPAAVKWAVVAALMNLDSASPEARAGALSNFTTPASHFDVRASMEKASLFGAGGGRCFSPFEEMRHVVTCPEGYVVDTSKSLDARCGFNRLSCPEGLTCLCSPCIPSVRVAIFPSEVVLGLACTLFVMNLAVVVFWGFGQELGGCARRPAMAAKEKAARVLRRRRSIRRYSAV